jgi:DNA-binding PucR family transcriptional regulator
VTTGRRPRIERINDLIGTDWQQTDLALRLQFAVRIRQLAYMLGAEQGE